MKLTIKNSGWLLLVTILGLLSIAHFFKISGSTTIIEYYGHMIGSISGMIVMLILLILGPEVL